MPRTAQRGSACSLGFNPTALASTPWGRRLEGQAEATCPHLRQPRAPEGRGRAKSWHPARSAACAADTFGCPAGQTGEGGPQKRGGGRKRPAAWAPGGFVFLGSGLSLSDFQGTTESPLPTALWAHCARSSVLQDKPWGTSPPVALRPRCFGGGRSRDGQGTPSQDELRATSRDRGRPRHLPAERNGVLTGVSGGDGTTATDVKA